MQAYLAQLRAGSNGIGPQTFNYYLQAVKQFCTWLVADRRASENPLAHVHAINARLDRRHDRRAFELDELRRLLQTTHKGPERFGATGPERSMVYRFAAETGLRAGEVRSLTASSFDFDRRIVTVRAAYSKGRREDILPLRPETAKELQNFLHSKTPNSPAFQMPSRRNLSSAMQADSADAGIPYVDDAGRYADFHSLRHTTASLLAAAGVHPKVAQAIMRHSDINLTMARYTHVFKGQESSAVAALPDLSVASDESARAVATGTDGEATSSDHLACYLALPCGKQRISVDYNGQKGDGDTRSETNSRSPLESQEPRYALKKTPKEPLPKEGIEPSPCCQDGILNPARLPIPPLRQH